MDIRLQQLSYSSRLTLHSCPRKYQLYKLNSVQEDADGTAGESVTFAFGHVVGQGIQSVLENKSEQQIYFDCFRMWEADLLADNPKQNKSFWLAIAAVQRFISMRSQGLLSGYKLAYWKDKPAVELPFIIKFPDGFTYKGFVDAVLVHEVTGEVMVLEVKTTSANYVAAATYKNSAQAIGYSIVLDALFPTLSSYKVQYLIYLTKSMKYEAMEFKKDYLSRALWIREILLDIEKIKLFEAASVYPMHGESCNDFYRECEYFNLCTLSTDKLTQPLAPEHEAKILESIETDFEISLTLHDLIESQMQKE
jgi:hypothetical protein